MEKLKDEKGKRRNAPRFLCDAHLKNFPKNEGAKWDSCVKKVKKSGTADNPYAVCTKSLGSKKEESDSETNVSIKNGEETSPEDINTLIVQNPAMNAASFLNLLKSKGFKITKEAEMSNPALNRAKHEKEAAKKVIERGNLADSYLSFRFVESKSGSSLDHDKFQNRFRVILIQEGLGNTKDGYFYTKDALKSAVPIFEGRKMYADHPSKMDEAIRPERSVRDVFGHFENVEYKEGEDSTGRLEADLVLLPDSDSDWVRARMAHAISYSKKYPDKDFIGLSINASGDAEPIDATEFAEKGDVVTSAKAKLSQAIADGLTEVKIVKTIDSAVSCDLVTEAGAKGKVLELLEAEAMAEEKKHEAEEKKKHEAEAEEKKHEAEDEKKEEKKHEAEDGKEDPAHDDEEQDKALILDQLKKHGLIKDGEDHEEALKAAKHYQKAYKSAGYKAEEAAHRACEAMKCAGHAHKAMEAEEKHHEESEAEEKHKEAEEKHKESAEVLKLRGENAKLKEALAAFETEKYLDAKLKESKLPMSVTKRFKESVKNFKGKKDIDDKFALFLEGYKATAGGEVGTESLDSCVVASEKTIMRESSKEISLDDCVE
mgnify:CR=1 FL=1